MAYCRPRPWPEVYLATTAVRNWSWEALIAGAVILASYLALETRKVLGLLFANLRLFLQGELFLPALALVSLDLLLFPRMTCLCFLDLRVIARVGFFFLELLVIRQLDLGLLAVPLLGAGLGCPNKEATQ